MTVKDLNQKQLEGLVYLGLVAMDILNIDLLKSTVNINFPALTLKERADLINYLQNVRTEEIKEALQ